jgi:hypothetical protein
VAELDPWLGTDESLAYGNGFRIGRASELSRDPAHHRWIT